MYENCTKKNRSRKIKNKSKQRAFASLWICVSESTKGKLEFWTLNVTFIALSNRHTYLTSVSQHNFSIKTKGEFIHFFSFSLSLPRKNNEIPTYHNDLKLPEFERFSKYLLNNEPLCQFEKKNQQIFSYFTK